jgi:hypothetical protein
VCVVWFPDSLARWTEDVQVYPFRSSSVAVVFCRSNTDSPNSLKAQACQSAEVRVVNQLRCFNKRMMQRTFQCLQSAPTSTPYWSSSARVYRPVHRLCKRRLLLLFVKWWDVICVCRYSVWLSVRHLGWVRPRPMFQKCRHSSVTRYIICGPSSAQFHHSDPRIFYIMLITSHVLTPLWDILVPYGPLHYPQNRRLADRRRKLLTDVHWYVVETVRDSLGPPSRVACRFPLYISIFLTIFLLLLPVFSEFPRCSLNDMSKQFGQ